MTKSLAANDNKKTKTKWNNQKKENEKEREKKLIWQNLCIWKGTEGQILLLTDYRPIANHMWAFWAQRGDQTLWLDLRRANIIFFVYLLSPWFFFFFFYSRDGLRRKGGTIVI